MDSIKIAKEVFDTEIKGLAEVANRIDQSFSEVVVSILQAEGKVIITGMGKSGLVGKKIAATLSSTGTSSFFIHPGEAYHGDLGMIESKDIVIAISNSGETQEVLKLLSYFKENKNTVIAMSNNLNSTLVKHSNHFLNIAVSKEACPLELAPTTSSTVTMAMGDAIAIALMRAKNFKEENFAKFHPGGSLGRKLLSKVKDYMISEDLPIVSQEDLFEKILSEITKGRCGIVVVRAKDEILGVITDGDIRRSLASLKEKVLTKKAKDIMTLNPKIVDANLKLIHAEEIMQESKITSLIVTESSRLVGILNRYDL